MRFSFTSYHGRHEFVLKAAGTRALKLLDVGNLGDGSSTMNLLKENIERHGGTYVGLDSNEQLTQKLGIPNQVVGDLHHTPFGDGEFDAIYAGEIIEHTWTPAQMIQECRRILKPGGMLILDTPNPYSMVLILRFLLRRQDTMGDNRILTYHEAADGFAELKRRGSTLLQPQHKIFFTPAMLKQLLETQGFVLKDIGCTTKASSLLHRLLLAIFPHTGPHLCCVAIKSTVQDAFRDVADRYDIP